MVYCQFFVSFLALSSTVSASRPLPAWTWLTFRFVYSGPRLDKMKERQWFRNLSARAVWSCPMYSKKLLLKPEGLCRQIDPALARKNTLSRHLSQLPYFLAQLSKSCFLFISRFSPPQRHCLHSLWPFEHSLCYESNAAPTCCWCQPHLQRAMTFCDWEHRIYSPVFQSDVLSSLARLLVCQFLIAVASWSPPDCSQNRLR